MVKYKLESLTFTHQNCKLKGHSKHENSHAQESFDQLFKSSSIYIRDEIHNKIISHKKVRKLFYK